MSKNITNKMNELKRIVEHWAGVTCCKAPKMSYTQQKKLITLINKNIPLDGDYCCEEMRYGTEMGRSNGKFCKYCGQKIGRL